MNGPVFAEAQDAALGGTAEGVLSEYVVLDGDGVIKFPEHLSYEEAATLPCAALTAWNGLFEATSLRTITAAASVNLAAVNYHFGTKEELFQAVLTRRLDPMNQERVEILTRLESRTAPAPLSCDRILMALFVPALRLARDPERGGKNFLRLLGRAVSP